MLFRLVLGELMGALSWLLQRLRLVDDIFVDRVNVEGREVQVCRPSLGGGAQTGRQQKVCIPGQDLGVGAACAQTVVLKGKIQRDVEQGLSGGGDERR